MSRTTNRTYTVLQWPVSVVLLDRPQAARIAWPTPWPPG
jgi:hypothetical protein